MNLKNVKIISNPVVLLNLCVMRDEKTDSQGVRIAARKITRCLLYEASQNLPLVEKEVKTPVASFIAKTIDPEINLIISPILRAGLIFTDEAIDILPQACIRHIGMYRDEKLLNQSGITTKFQWKRKILKSFISILQTLCLQPEIRYLKQ